MEPDHDAFQIRFISKLENGLIFSFHVKNFTGVSILVGGFNPSEKY